ETRTHAPAASGEVANVPEAFLKFSRRMQFPVADRVRHFEFDDVNGRARGLQLGIELMRQRTQAYAHTERGFLPQRPDQRQYHLLQDDGIFSSLDVHVGDARRTMLQEHFRELLVDGAEARERAIVASHPAIRTILPAVV